MPSPMTMDVPSMVMNKRKCFANWLFSMTDFTAEARLSRRFGTSSWKLDTSLSSACWFGVRPTLAYRHMREYKANEPPAMMFNNQMVLDFQLYLVIIICIIHWMSS